MQNKPDFYEHHATIAPGKPARFDYCPRELSSLPWQFFFDEGACALELTSVMSGAYENLVAAVPASLFVFALPYLLLGRLRAPVRATVALFNPTTHPIAVRVWIGEFGALRTELTRLQAKDPHAK